MSYARTAKLLAGALVLNIVEGVNAVLQAASAQNEKPELQFLPPAYPGKGCSNSVNASNPCQPLTLEQGLEIGGSLLGAGLLGLLGYGLYKKCKTKPEAAVAADLEAGNGNYKALNTGPTQGK
jgi:hypothetical protein